MWNDLRFALRGLRRTPLFTGVAVLSLALGIGANTAIFSLIHQVLLRFLPVKDPQQLVILHSEGPRHGLTSADNTETVFSYPQYRALRDHNQVFSDVCARSPAVVNVVAGGQAEQAYAEAVTGDFFHALGVEPFIGRLFTPADDITPRGHPLAVLSYGYWSRRFGARTAIQGETIRINGQPMTVIGVTPRTFRGLISGREPALWVPTAMRALVSMNPGVDDLNQRDSYWLNVFGRLKPGVPLRTAEASLGPLYHAILADDLPAQGDDSAHYREKFLATRLTLRSAAQGINALQEQWQRPLVAVMAMVGLVLLIACANVANLMVSRAVGRRREITVRLAVGAGRGALVRLFLMESLLLALAGGMVGLVFTPWITQGLIALVPADELGGWLQPGVDLRLLAFAFAVSICTGLLFGMAPALSAARLDLATALRDHGSTVYSGQAGLRRVLVAAQVGLSMVVLIAAGLFARSLVNLLHQDLGFPSERLLVFQMSPAMAGYSGPSHLALLERVKERLAALPGVVSAVAALGSPLGGGHMNGNINPEGYQKQEDEDTSCSLDFIAPGYFRTLGVPLAAGREFTTADRAGSPRVVIINAELADRYFKGRNPVGLRLGFGSDKPTIEIVGVVRNSVYSSLREKSGRFFYLSYLQPLIDPPLKFANASFLLRTARNDATLPSQVRSVVREIDPNLPLEGLGWMDRRVESSVYLERLIAWLAGGFGCLAMLLAAIGLYGVIAYMAARRTAEIGIRVALGATRGSILRLVLREVALLTGTGLAIGIPCALAAGRYIESQLFGIRASDPLVMIAAAALLALAALFAGYLPAHRAATIDPLQALHYE